VSAGVVVLPCLMISLFSSCREIFPYLVVVIGLENVLVLTKSVVSTPVDLEVKLRIAQGKDSVCLSVCVCVCVCLCVCCVFRYSNTFTNPSFNVLFCFSLSRSK